MSSEGSDDGFDTIQQLQRAQNTPNMHKRSLNKATKPIFQQTNKKPKGGLSHNNLNIDIISEEQDADLDDMDFLSDELKANSKFQAKAVAKKRSKSRLMSGGIGFQFSNKEIDKLKNNGGEAIDLKFNDSLPEEGFDTNHFIENVSKEGIESFFENPDESGASIEEPSQDGFKPGIFGSEDEGEGQSGQDMEAGEENEEDDDIQSGSGSEQNIGKGIESSEYDDSENQDDIHSLADGDLSKYNSPQEKGRINPQINLKVKLLAEKLNNSVNMSINANRRSMMQVQATKNIANTSDNDMVAKKRLEDLQKLRIDSLKKQDKYMENKSVSGSKKNSMNHSKSARKIGANHRLNNLLKLGSLGLDLEELSVGMERKYEEMLVILRKNIHTIRQYFLERLDRVQKEFNEKIMNEKHQNLSNMKELEENLKTCMEAKSLKAQQGIKTTDETEKSLFAFQQMFKFMKEFKEESHSLILSRPVDLDLDFLKKELSKNFVDKYLNRLTDPPKAFPTELYRFFYNNNNEVDEFEEDITYGRAMTINGGFPQSMELEKIIEPIDPQMNNNSRAPIIKIIDNKYMITATRDQFKLFVHTWGVKSLNVQKASQFSKYNKGKDMGTGDNKFLHNLLISSEDIDFDVQDPGFHCVEHLRTKEGKRYLLFGGNFNKIYKFELCGNGGVIDQIQYQGVIDLKKNNDNLPRQKVNGIFQYKTTKHIIAILSYGYAVTFTLEDAGKDDNKMNCIRLHRGNISSGTFVNDYQYFVTSSGSFSRNHDNTIVISKCSLAQDLFIKSIHSFSNAHGKFKGVMNIQSSNNIGDNLLVSCGNQDDGRIIVWDIENRESVVELANFNTNEELRQLGKGVFYYLNIIILNDDPENSEDQPQEEDLKDNWAVSGILVVAASISNMYFFGYDFKNKKMQKIVSFKVNSDIGSYLSIMQTVRHLNIEDEGNDNSEKITILVGTVSGKIEVFKLCCQFDYGAGFLGDLNDNPNDMSKESLGFENNLFDQSITKKKGRNLRSLKLD